ncbi:MAG: TonB-dependent receptor [Bryobacterales bacterium]|nr:TonB-dependent receptor [Bryobacteraceae bacterium]MDW8355112.1 TonB-dependent receptor [Bryobacterales bacterium]
MRSEGERFTTKTCLCLVSCGLSLALAAHPVEITGTVVDSSGRAVPAAEVTCGFARATTGPDGRFRFSGIERCRASVAAPGFETLRTELAAGAETRLELRVAGPLERVVVTATRSESTAEETGVAATVITRADLEQRQFPMVLEALRTVPGLFVVQTGRRGGLTAVFTRGAQRTGTLFLVDGVPVNDPGGEFNAAHLTSGTLERVEMVRGPESALFGTDAAAGVVQLFTRRGDPEAAVPRGTLAYDRGSFQTDRWSAGLAGGSGARFDYALHAEQLRSAGEFPNDHYRNTTGSLNAGIRFSEATQLRGVFRAMDSTLGVPGQVAFGLVDHDAFETNRDYVVSLRLEDARGSRYLQSASFGHHRVRDVYTNQRLDGPYALAALVRDVAGPPRRTYLVRLLDPRRLPVEIPTGTRLVQREVTLFPSREPFVSATSRTRAGYQGSLTHGAGTATFGYEYERQEGDISKREVARNRHGVFAHEQRSLGGRLFVAGGLRVEHSSAFGARVAPRGAASLLVSGERGALSSAWLRFSAGRGITEPSLLQNFAREAFFTGNPDLRPEKTTSYEAGLVAEWFGRRLHAEAAAFHSSFQDLIAFVSLPPPTWGSWANVEASRARGVELAAAVRLPWQVQLRGAYLRLWTRILRSNAPASPFTGVGQELGRRPGNSGSLSLAITPRRWMFQAGAVLAGERQDSDFWLGVNRNPGYQLVYASGSLRLTRHVTPFFQADNVLNARYQEALGYSSLGRSLRGGVRLAW